LNPLTRREFLTMLALTPLQHKEPKKWCVLLIDCVFNPADTNPFDRFPGLKEIENIKAVLLRANELRAPVININYKNLFIERRLLPSTNYTIPEIWALRDTNWMHLQKPESDAFKNTDLASTLRRLAVTDIIFIGWDQHACVRETVEGAIRNGYRKENLHTCFDIMQGTFTTPQNYIQMKSLSITGKPKIGEELDLNNLKKYYRTRTKLAKK
jgi:hypothetical protein